MHIAPNAKCQRVLVLTVWLVCWLMKVKASHSHKGPYDFDLLVPVQELTSQKMVSSVTCFCICIFTGGKKQLITMGQSKRCHYILPHEFTNANFWNSFTIRLGSKFVIMSRLKMSPLVVHIPLKYLVPVWLTMATGAVFVVPSCAYVYLIDIWIHVQMHACCVYVVCVIMFREVSMYVCLCCFSLRMH